MTRAAKRNQIIFSVLRTFCGRSPDSAQYVIRMTITASETAVTIHFQVIDSQTVMVVRDLVAQVVPKDIRHRNAQHAARIRDQERKTDMRQWAENETDRMLEQMPEVHQIIQAGAILTIAEPQPNPLIATWICQILAEGVGAVHVFCEKDDAALACTIETRDIPVPIRARNFIILEIPIDPTDGPGYRIFSKIK